MTQHRSIARLMDANGNRALEGLRVCEEIARFHCEAAGLFRQTRRVRHALGQALGRLPVSPFERVRARASRRDPGRRAASHPVASLEQLLIINFQRAKEALRTLEECARLAAPSHTKRFQDLRFRTYALERAFLLHLAAVRHH